VGLYPGGDFQPYTLAQLQSLCINFLRYEGELDQLSPLHKRGEGGLYARSLLLVSWLGGMLLHTGGGRACWVGSAAAGAAVAAAVAQSAPTINPIARAHTLQPFKATSSAEPDISEAERRIKATTSIVALQDLANPGALTRTSFIGV